MHEKSCFLSIALLNRAISLQQGLGRMQQEAAERLRYPRVQKRRRYVCSLLEIFLYKDLLSLLPRPPPPTTLS